MPTSTFFRLPEEKRQRLIDAAVAEFSQTTFSDVSINKIILSAHIPRGSFYQYFEDKDDLFRYLIGEMRDYFYKALMEILDEAGGDLFSVSIQAYDRFMSPSGWTDPMLGRCIQIMRVNPNMDMSWLLDRTGEMFPLPVYERFDTSRFRRQDHTFIDHTFFLTIMPLAHAIMETLRAPDQRDLWRQMLVERIEIVKYGTLRPTESMKEVTPCAITN